MRFDFIKLKNCFPIIDQQDQHFLALLHHGLPINVWRMRCWATLIEIRSANFSPSKNRAHHWLPSRWQMCLWNNCPKCSPSFCQKQNITFCGKKLRTVNNGSIGQNVPNRVTLSTFLTDFFAIINFSLDFKIGSICYITLHTYI
jgi:hypothetical protein